MSPDQSGTPVLCCIEHKGSSMAQCTASELFIRALHKDAINSYNSLTGHVTVAVPGEYICVTLKQLSSHVFSTCSPIHCTCTYKIQFSMLYFWCNKMWYDQCHIYTRKRKVSFNFAITKMMHFFPTCFSKVLGSCEIKVRVCASPGRDRSKSEKKSQGQHSPMVKTFVNQPQGQNKSN